MRVIDNDDLAGLVIERGYVNGCKTTESILAELRAETPNWWNDIDPENPDTWVDAWAFNSGERDKILIMDVRDYLNTDGTRTFIASTGRSYVDAMPLAKVPFVKV